MDYYRKLKINSINVLKELNILKLNDFCSSKYRGVESFQKTYGRIRKKTRIINKDLDNKSVNAESINK